MALGRRLWLGLWSLLLPVSLYALLALVFLDSFDFSSTTVNTVTVMAGGALAGLIVGFGFGLRDWRVLIPPLATGLVGLGLYPLLEGWLAGENETPGYVLVWIGQFIAMYVSTWLSLTVGIADTPEVVATHL